LFCGIPPEELWVVVGAGAFEEEVSGAGAADFVEELVELELELPQPAATSATSTNVEAARRRIVMCFAVAVTGISVSVG
jgi:hypothetical protein